MTTLFDKLDVDRTAGITDDEIKAIQNMLEKVKVRAAQVAEVNDADETKRILNAYYAFLSLFVGRAAGDIEAAFVTIQGALSGSAAPRALGGGSHTSDPGDLQDELDAANTKVLQLETDRAALEEALVIMGVSRLMPDAHYDKNNIRNSVRTKLADAERVAAASVVPANFVEKAAVKAKLDEAIRLASNLSTSTLSNTVTGKDALTAKLGEITPLVS